MSLAPRLDLRQSQSLVMTPQLQQAIRLLALSNLEIETFLAEEVAKNPLLETAREDLTPAAAEAEQGPEWDAAAAPPDPATAGADQLVMRGDGAGDAPLDADFAADAAQHDSAIDAPRGGLDGGLGLDGVGGAGSADGPDFDAFAADQASLHDYLLVQAGEALAGSDLLIARHLIDLIDDAGYLCAPPIDIAGRLGVSLHAVERVLGVIHGFDPTGVGARDLAECLALQAKEADRHDPCMAALLANLDLLAKGQLAQLRRIARVDEDDLSDMIRELRGYDPKPGLRYGGSSRVEAVSPDVFVARTKGGWAIELNAATLPRLIVDRGYYGELVAGGDKASRAWANDALQSANWLVKALDQRARTIVKVATEIVRQQEGFFLHGVEALKPLTLRAVADVVGLHESTISRVTSNKYLSCERGLFELKYFFTSGVAAEGGEGASAEAVKSHIARLIAGEGSAILSDDKLVELLRAKGFDIARRTVAKYREAIGLGSSVQRRRQRAIG